MTRARLGLGLACAVALSSVHADAHEPRELTLTTPLALGLESLGVVAAFAAYSSAADPLPERCRWCDPGAFDESVRGALRARSPRPPALASHALSLGVVPLGSFAALLVPALQADRAGFALEDGWIILNAMVLTTGLTDGTKKLTARQRPAFHHGRQAETEASGDAGKLEENLSFFSGDTAWAFSAASSAATLAFLRGYPTAPHVAAAGGALALTTGVLRISADMHWATDVIAGAFAGAAVGVGLPLLLHRRASAPAGLQVTPALGRGSSLVMVGGVF